MNTLLAATLQLLESEMGKAQKVHLGGILMKTCNPLAHHCIQSLHTEPAQWPFTYLCINFFSSQVCENLTVPVSYCLEVASPAYSYLKRQLVVGWHLSPLMGSVCPAFFLFLGCLLSFSALSWPQWFRPKAPLQREREISAESVGKFPHRRVAASCCKLGTKNCL